MKQMIAGIRYNKLYFLNDYGTVFYQAFSRA